MVCLGTVLAVPFWRLLPLLSRTLTYPWQLMLLVGIWLAWLAGDGGRKLLGMLPERNRELTAVSLTACLCTLALLDSYSYLNPVTVDQPIPDAPLAIFGDNEIALLSAEASGDPRPGSEIAAVTNWQALRPLDRDYTVFFHAEDAASTLLGQQDTMPRGNKLPTSQWRAGQVISDRYELQLNPDATAVGGYRYLLGLYDWQTGKRLMTGNDDKVVLTP